MRIFQNSALYPSYLPRLNQLAAKAVSFADRRAVFLNDRFGAPHFLQPVLDGASEAFFTNGDDEILQRQWALEPGVPGKPTLEAILLAQVWVETKRKPTEGLYGKECQWVHFKRLLERL
jgi:hypothetical protein